MKKCLSIVLSLLIALSCVTPVMAESREVELPPVDAAYIRKDAGNANKTMGGNILVVDNRSSSRRMCFLKFDFSAYTDNLDSISVLRLALASKDAKGDTNFTLAIMPDSMENWTSANLTYNMADDAGMTDSQCGELLYTSEAMTNNVYTWTDNIAETVKTHLRENPDNAIVTFKVDTSKEQPYVIHGVGSDYPPKLKLTNISPDHMVQEVYDSLTFDKISDDPQGEVSSRFHFVTIGDDYGTTITWTSSDPTTVDPDSGSVNRPRWGQGDKQVTLTALIKNGDSSLTKSFEITVPESNIYPNELLREYTFYSECNVNIRGGRLSNNTYYNENIIVDSRTSGDNRRMGFLKFDFTGLEEYVAQAQEIELRITTNGDANAADRNNLEIYVLPEELEGFDPTTLNYSNAGGLVDYKGNRVHEEENILPNTTYKTANLLPEIMENLKVGDNSVVWLKMDSSKGVGYPLYGSTEVNLDRCPALIIRYPRPACDLDLLTLELPQVVNGDITLPASGKFGSAITWKSLAPDLITSGGKVTVGTADENYSSEDGVAVLTASAVSGADTFEMQYPVRVRRNGIVDAREAVTVGPTETTGGETLNLGGESGYFSVISFEAGDDDIRKSRKIALKLYGADNYEGAMVTALPVTDNAFRNQDLTELTYDRVQQMAEEVTADGIEAQFLGESYVVFDVTEYMRSLADGKAMFVLKTNGPRLSLAAKIFNSEPKLIVSSIAYTDEYGAQAVADSLTLSDLTDEPAENIRGDLTLPQSGRFSARITWTSDSPAVLNIETGAVTRPSADTPIVLTAHITVGGVTVEKSFEMVIRKEETVAEYTEYLLSTLAPDGDILTQSIRLKGEDLPDGATVNWSCNDPCAATEGFQLKITRPADSDVTVGITAILCYQGVTVTGTFPVTVVCEAKKNILWNRKITDGDETAVQATDENITTVWNATGKSFTVDLGSSKVISRLTLVPDGTSFSGLTVSVSDDMYRWSKAYSGGSFAADKMNYITLAPASYSRYVRFVFPDSAAGIAFLAAYSKSATDESDGDVFGELTVPAEAKMDFTLPDSLYGNAITWTSSSGAIRIDGVQAKVYPTASGSNVTLTAKVSINGTAYSRAYVVYVPGTGNTGGSSGGSSGGGSGMIAAPPLESASETNNNGNNIPNYTGAGSAFTDLDTVPWAAEYINRLADKRIINGKAEGIFAPGDNIKREEMAKIIVPAFQLSMDGEDVSFADVNADEWYAPYVLALARNGITKGMGDGTFGIGLDISRQDAFTMIAAVMGVDILSGAEEVSGFTDDDSIADYARGSVNALKKLGIVSGDENGAMNPTASITRAEMAKVICLAVDK